MNILIAGYNDISKNLIEEIKSFSQITLLERKEKKELVEKDNLEGINLLFGDISEPDIIKEIVSRNYNILIACYEEDRLNYSICKFLSNHIPNKISLLNLEVNERLYEDIKEKVHLVKKGKVLSKYIKNLLDPNKRENISIGLGGDIIELKVLPNSILAYQKVSKFFSSKWKVVAIYRDNKIILPKKNTKILPGDKVLIVGHPETLENIISLLLKNEPQFPLNYGYAQVVILKDLDKNFLEENLFLYSKTKVREIDFFPLNLNIDIEIFEKTLKSISINKLLSYKIINTLDNIDIGFISVKKEQSKLKKISFLISTKNALALKYFKKYNVPVFLCTGKNSYKNILCPIFDMEESLKALEVSFQLSKMFNIDLYILIIRQIEIVDQNINVTEIKKQIDIFQRMYKITPKIINKIGNPVKITCQISQDFDLVVTCGRIEESSHILKPYPPYLIALLSSSSSLLVPYQS